jgi:renal tumor antigen
MGHSMSLQCGRVAYPACGAGARLRDTAASTATMHKYRLVAKKGEGTFSEVLKAQCIKNGKYVAIKCMKNHFDSLDQVNNLREIQALRRLSPHAHIIKLLEVLYDQPTGRLALVFELMDMNIYELIRGRRHYVAEDRIRNYMYQLMKAMDHMHRNGIFHRDIKVCVYGEGGCCLMRCGRQRRCRTRFKLVCQWLPH